LRVVLEVLAVTRLHQFVESGIVDPEQSGEPGSLTGIAEPVGEPADSGSFGSARVSPVLNDRDHP
jgi:hypothetical protein